MHMLVVSAIALVLLFWAVGAYNRLVRLRAQVLQAFAALDALLQRLSAWMGNGPVADAGETALGAANAQFAASLAVARANPLDAAALQALAAGQQVLLGTWQSAHLQQLDDAARAEQQLQLEALRAPVALAGQQLGQAVGQYNHAIGQFPALVLAWLFGFKKAGAL